MWRSDLYQFITSYQLRHVGTSHDPQQEVSAGKNQTLLSFDLQKRARLGTSLANSSPTERVQFVYNHIMASMESDVSSDTLTIKSREYEYLGKPGKFLDFYTASDRMFLEHVLAERIAGRELEPEDRQHLAEIKECRPELGTMLEYEFRASMGLPAEMPVCYVQLYGESDLITSPEERKRFMPMVFRDISKRRGDSLERCRKLHSFMIESGMAGGMHGVIRNVTPEMRSKKISDARLAQTQGDRPIEDRKALTATERSNKRYVKKKKPSDAEKAEKAKIRKQKKAILNKAAHSKRVAETESKLKNPSTQ
jgi:hypothetical protein